ncbi:MAG: dual specificity protein phosphatase family protein [Deltaproteobacteria bacterium]|nr:dual specificity protein phosphatase family protein [Deltaproteobacteria bacterium]
MIWTKVYAIQGIRFRLAIMAHPHGGSLHDDLASWQMQGVEVVVSLLERAEVRALYLQDEQSLCEARGMTFLSYPIVDRSVPSDIASFSTFLEQLAGILTEGKAVAIHCRMGIGRSALTAACILVYFGVGADEAFELIGRSRGCAVPDTKEQFEWVTRFAEQMRTDGC